MNMQEMDDALKEADRRMKLSDGHAYLTILKTRCQNCGRSPSQNKGKRCGGWFNTFISEYKSVLIDRGFLTEAKS